MAEYVAVDAFKAIADALSSAGVRYMVVGGLAMQAHGSDRVTYDVDLVVQLEAENVLRAFAALSQAGYRPSVPVLAEQFADSTRREQLRAEKGMVVLNFWSDRYRATPLDIFVTEPFDFELEYSLALRDTSFEGIELCFPRAETLLAMKKLASRPKDQHDIAYLEALLG
ncbi:MAG TPA: nucleotidyl transferase AbiEii/AbiGii toxin family protein [Solimonas sp.]|nr:nucleotidyl transferase AbiEii/AbiGii toxin family protein [Solimonas sp.]